jgi:uncharacterized protein
LNTSVSCWPRNTGHDATGAAVGLFSTSGFTEELAAEAAASRGNIILADLDILYGQQP